MLFGALVVVPVLLAGTLIVVLDRLNAQWLTEPVTIRAGLSRLEQISLRPKDVLKALIALVVLTWLGQFGGLGAVTSVGLVAILFWVLWKGMRTSGPKPDDLVRDLRDVTDKATQASDMLRSLSDVLLAKQGELNQMERLRAELDAAVDRNRKDAQSWASISDDSKADLVKALRRDAQRGWFWRGLAAVILAVSLNLLATGIWVMAGNPGQEQIVGAVRDVRDSVVQVSNNFSD